MAFVSSGAEQKEEEEKQSGMNTISSSQGAGIASPTGPAKGTQKGGSGQFTNIQDYIKANQPKTQQLAQGITKNVKDKATGLGSQLQQQKESYLGEQGKFGQGASQFIGQQIQQAGQGEQKQEDIDKFRNLATGSIQGPDLTEQRLQAQDLERQAKEFETSKGRFEALGNLVGNQSTNYGKGQQQLDQLLLAGDKNAKQSSIRDIQATTKGLSNQVGSLESDIIAGREASQQEALSAVDAAQAAQKQMLEDKVATAEQLGSIPALNTAFQTGQFTPELLAELGLSDNRTYGVDASQYLKGAPDITNVASQDDLARANALAALEGTSQDLFLDPAMVGTYGDTEKASIENFRDAVSGAKSAYEAEASPYTSLSDLANRYITAYNKRPESNDVFDVGAATDENFTKDDFLKYLKATTDPSGIINTDDFRNYTGSGFWNPAVYAKLVSDYTNQKLSPIQAKYNYGNVLGAKDGGVIKDPRKEALRKMRGY